MVSVLFLITIVLTSPAGFVVILLMVTGGLLVIGSVVLIGSVLTGFFVALVATGFRLIAGVFLVVFTRLVAVVVLLVLVFVDDCFVVVLGGVVVSADSTMNVVLIISSSDSVDGSTFTISAGKKFTKY